MAEVKIRRNAATADSATSQIHCLYEPFGTRDPDLLMPTQEKPQDLIETDEVVHVPVRAGSDRNR
jgi:hypothetical protein